MDDVRESVGEVLEAVEEDVSRLAGVLQQIVGPDRLEDGVQEDQLACENDKLLSNFLATSAFSFFLVHISPESLTRISDPGVEDLVGVLGPQLRLVVQPAGQHLLGERDDVGRLAEVEVLVGPHLAGRAAARLHLVHQVGDLTLLANVLKALGGSQLWLRLLRCSGRFTHLEPGGAAVVIPALGLDGLHDDSGDGVALLQLALDDLLDQSQATFVLGLVLPRVVLQRVPREMKKFDFGQGTDWYVTTCSEGNRWSASRRGERRPCGWPLSGYRSEIRVFCRGSRRGWSYKGPEI